MDDKLLVKKIQALLHDPPEKPIILGRIGHEGRAREIMAAILAKAHAKITDEVRTADHIASAADRINLPQDERFISDFRKNPVIIHPLSGTDFDLKSLAQVEIGEITAAVDRSLVALSEKYANDLEKLYLALWRELLDLLIRDPAQQSRLGQLWELLPADTRMPDHSIWEHKRITSAIAGALPKPAFLLFAIGPVQEFIATARKTQDLWAGSYLLSYLSWSAMKVVAEEFGPDSLIFPDLCGQPVTDLWVKEKGLEIEGNLASEQLSSPTLPNRFLAIVPESAVADIANKAKKAVKETFLLACNAIKEKMTEKLEISSEEWDAIWQRQTEGFMETYWTATAVDNHTDFLKSYKSLLDIKSDWKFNGLFKEYEEKGFAPNIGTVYGQIYCLTEKSLGSRKVVRDFKQQSEPNFKCTLCGVREPVHPGTDKKGQSCFERFGVLKGFWQDTVMPAFPQIRKSERLCSVCVTKRLVAPSFFRGQLRFNISNSFPSISIVATASFKEKVIKNLPNPELRMRVDDFVRILHALFGGKDDHMKGEALRMVWGMCNNPETVTAEDKEVAQKFASVEGDWLYEDSFAESLKEEISTYAQDLCSAARSALRQLLKAAKKLGIDPPSKYYAVLLMDGDNMGKWLSGEIAPKIEDILHPAVRNSLGVSWNELKRMERPLNPSLHLAMSKALRDFSLKVAREIVEKDHLGKLVYAGGDDVLAFVNLRDLPEVMRKLRAYFSGSLHKGNDDTIKIDFKNGSGFIPVDVDGEPINVDSYKPVKGFMLSMGTNATASMGVVIAHHSSNLSQVLDEVRACEKQAKKMDGKNAFCIALAKRAGGTEHVSSKWYYENISLAEKGRAGGFFETIPLLRDWADAFYYEHISPKFVYTFRTETKGLEYKDSNGKIIQMPAEAIRLELQRIAKRQTKGNNKDKVKDLIDGLMQLHSSGLTIDELGKFLSIAAFLGREGNR